MAFAIEFSNLLGVLREEFLVPASLGSAVRCSDVLALSPAGQNLVRANGHRIAWLHYTSNPSEAEQIAEAILAHVESKLHEVQQLGPSCEVAAALAYGWPQLTAYSTCTDGSCTPPLLPITSNGTTVPIACGVADEFTVNEQWLLVSDILASFGWWPIAGSAGVVFTPSSGIGSTGPGKLQVDNTIPAPWIPSACPNPVFDAFTKKLKCQ